MKQIFHHYTKWEDFQNGMWSKIPVEKEKEILPFVIEFTGNHVLYGQAMQRVIISWPFACEHNLSDLSINRQAWIGHAACSLEHSWPEYMVRWAWGLLTEPQQRLANLQADRAILQWEKNYLKQKNAQISLTF